MKDLTVIYGGTALAAFVTGWLLCKLLVWLGVPGLT